jgi:hypothetical protein
MVMQLSALSSTADPSRPESRKSGIGLRSGQHYWAAIKVERRGFETANA